MPANPQRRSRNLLRIVLLIVGFTSFAAASLRWEWLEEIEARTWDWRLRYVAGQERADPDIKILLIDQSSLQHFSRQDAVVWPWFREMYAAVVSYLRDAGARAVAFDILFTEPSSYGVEDDQAFANSLKGTLPIVMAGALRQTTGSGLDVQDGEAFREYQDSKSVGSALRTWGLDIARLSSHSGIELPIREYWPERGGVGNVSASPDSDGIFRHALPAGKVGDIPIAGLSFALYDAAFPAQVPPRALSEVVDPKGRLTLRFKGPARTYETFGIDSIIVSQRQRAEGKAPLVPLERFANALVLVGMDAPGLLDLRPTPLSQVFPGVEYNATVLDNFMNGEFIERVGIPLNLAIVALLVAVCAAATLYLSSIVSQALIIVSLLAIFTYSTFAAALAGYWLNLTLPLGSSFFSVLIALGIQYQSEGRERRFLRSAFQQYVSSDVIEKIISDPNSLTLGGERRTLTIFFSDIAGFTSISEKLLPEQLGRLLNIFLSEMTAIIMEYGGTVDKYVGDAIVAFWNAPIAIPNHAEQAVRAALECQRRIESRREAWRAEFGVDISMRIGLNTGEVSVGNFGSSSRFNYTIVGDAANLASRLEGANKKFGTKILMASSTWQEVAATSLKARRVGAVQVVGKTESVQVFQPYSEESIPDLSEALSEFEAKHLEEANRLFSQHLNDPLALAYLKRIEMVRQVAATSIWDPVWELSEK